MSNLMESLNQVLKARSESCETMLDAERQLAESLTFSSIDEIMQLLGRVNKYHLMEFPVWAHLLAYRLACLLQPDNPEIRRQAAALMLMFGPDWDEEANRLEIEASRIEARSNAS